MTQKEFTQQVADELRDEYPHLTVDIVGTDVKVRDGEELILKFDTRDKETTL